MLVDVPLLLEDVVEIPDLDAPVDRRRDDTVVGADHQRLDLHNPLEKDGVDLLRSFAWGHLKVSHHPFHQITSLHVPTEQFLSDKRFHSFVKQITKNIVPIT